MNHHLTKDIPIIMHWECDKCHNKNKGNLLRKALYAKEEVILTLFKPDISLFDKNGNYKPSKELIIYEEPCEKCRSILKKCYFKTDYGLGEIRIDDFTREEVEEAKKAGVKIDYMSPNRKPYFFCKKCRLMWEKFIRGDFLR